MYYIILLLIVAGFSILSFFVYKLWRTVYAIENNLPLVNMSVKQIHARIDKIFTIDAPEPNDATKVDKNEVDLSETESFQIPKDVKLDIEGGDSQTPPGFEEKKN